MLPTAHFGISHNHSPLLGALNITLVIASNAISDGHEVETGFVEYVIVLGGEFEESFGESVVKVFLFGGVV